MTTTASSSFPDGLDGSNRWGPPLGYRRSDMGHDPDSHVREWECRVRFPAHRTRALGRAGTAGVIGRCELQGANR